MTSNPKADQYSIPYSDLHLPTGINHGRLLFYPDETVRAGSVFHYKIIILASMLYIS